MKQILPACGVEVVEIERTGGISASLVRRALDAGDLDTVRALVPATTADYILKGQTE